MKVSVYNQEGKAVGDVELNAKVFEVKPSLHVLAEVSNILQGNARQGSSNTLTRGEVRGGGKKPWKQKGTGRARAGSTRSPLWRHGGVTFGPRANQNWERKVNKKTKRKALFMALSDKAQGGHFIVIDKIEIEPKTKAFVKVLAAISGAVSGAGKKQVLLMPKADAGLTKASRNVPNVTPVTASTLGLLEVLRADSLIVLKDSLPVIEKTFLKA